MNLNIFSDLRKPGLVPGESLSPSIEIDPVKEKYSAYNMTNRMRSFHMKTVLHVIIIEVKTIINLHVVIADFFKPSLNLRCSFMSILSCVTSPPVTDITMLGGLSFQ